jgi:pimeloyl-ACP methyl ester carboxylesterase
MFAQAGDEPGPFPPSGDERRLIVRQKHQLASAIQELKRLPNRGDLLPDVEIYLKAAEWILRFPEEFFTPDFTPNTIRTLDSGLRRAAELKAGNPSWTSRAGHVLRAYRSRVDDSLQPFAVALPPDYDPAKAYRLDLILHGRNSRLNEVSFIASIESPPAGKAPPPPPSGRIELHVFGRTNNAYRWAGETDVFEAIEAARRLYRVRDNQIVLRGFSMGGAGAWHLGLHYPDRWAVFEAGAGFNETKRYAKIPSPPPWQDKAMRIYDAVEYALNGVNIPFVGYGGELDPQLQASLNIRDKLQSEGLNVADLGALFLVGPQTEHRWHPDSKRQSEEFIAQVLARPRPTPNKIRFVTYTLRYHRCYWLRLDALEQHYERAEIEAVRHPDRISVRTANLNGFTLDTGGRIEIGGQTITAPVNRPVSLERFNGSWRIAGEPTKSLRKRHGLQGPIDDAFLDSFLCVRPTSEAMHASVGALAVERLETFQREFAKWLRGDVRIKPDYAVTENDIREHHLVLFGDPAGNGILRRIANRLPITWDKDSIRFNTRRYRSDSHLLAMIYPNPLNPDKYVVLNSGHTFGEKEFRGTNALLFPRLGDYAVLTLEGQVAEAGFFDENWSLPGQQPRLREAAQ